ncbi:SMI1/KNR4 family protein [uncultured Ruminococcus sp.]|uniref:SMI1/KNR4 family protein n=1 Tax=Ruminococcus flavefaciens TaxID=1265 RepID=UPI0013DB6E61
MEERIKIIKGITDDWMESELYPPATDSQISEFEEKMKVIIPESYKEFLRYSNGAELFGGDALLFSVNIDDEYKMNYDFSEGNVPKELLIIGYYNSKHICFDSRDNSFIFYEYEEYDDIKDECIHFLDFYGVLDFMIDIATN